MQLLLICAVGILNIICFLVGEKAGRRSAGGQAGDVSKVEVKQNTPKMKKENPIRARQKAKEAQIQEDRYRRIMENIEAYDGTDQGQQDV